MKFEQCFLKIMALGLFCLLMALPTRTVAQTTNYKAYAIFIYNFTKYVHWPEGSMQGEFKITVVGNSKVTPELTGIVQNKTVLGKKIIVTHVNTLQELPHSHLVYLSGTSSGDLDELLQKVAGKPILVVTERDGLIRKGAMISFVTLEDNSLRFTLNDKALSSYNLQVANELKTLAYKE
jgi:hypothetical protein